MNNRRMLAMVMGNENDTHEQRGQGVWAEKRVGGGKLRVSKKITVNLGGSYGFFLGGG